MTFCVGELGCVPMEGGGPRFPPSLPQPGTLPITHLYGAASVVLTPAPPWVQHGGELLPREVGIPEPPRHQHSDPQGASRILRTRRGPRAQQAN